MLRSIFRNIYSFWSRVANIGVTAELSFHEKKKTQLLNVVVASGIPMNLYFTLLNLSQQRTLLAIINILLFSGAILILIINSYRKFLLGRLVLTFLASVLFMLSAVLFRNGGEYYLVANLMIIIIYFNEKKYIALISLFNCLLFLGIKIFFNESSYSYGTVPFSRVIFNISWALMVMILALLYFKKEQHDYQDEIEAKNKELEELNDTKEKLFSIIAHDLRSPIAQLKNSLDLVNKEYMSPETFAQVTTKLSSEVDQLHSTLDNLLRWSIGQFQGIKAVPERVSLDKIIEKKATLFKQTLESKQIRLEYRPTNLFVMADPNHLLLVLRNLFSNAIKYSYRDGCIVVSAYRKAGRVVIEIADSGMGMTDEIKSSIFSSSSIISNTGTSNEKGTGLGLKLCKEFIEKNNGQIWLESTEQIGTCFFISLPGSA